MKTSKIRLFKRLLISVSLALLSAGAFIGCETLANKVTTFPEIDSFNQSRVGVVLNLVGGHTGYGDITGPLWTLLELKKSEKFKDKSFVVILDDYSYDIMKNLYNFQNLNDFSNQLGISFISPRQSNVIKHADYILELFSAGREARYQKNHQFRSEDTILVISDPMHEAYLDLIKKKDITLYFNPPGIGKERSGIVDNPDINAFINQGLAKSKRIASERFSDPVMKQIILKEGIFHDANLGFLYGAHNTRKKYEKAGMNLVGQTKAFLLALKTNTSPNSPIIVITPNKRKIFEELLGNEIKIWSLDELKQLTSLENKVYLVAIGPITSYQFGGLVAAADVPLLLEGNSAISTAIKLKKPFLFYKSAWNWPQIEDMIQFEEKELGTTHFAEAYKKDPGKLPDFDRFLSSFSRFHMEIFFSALKHRVANFTKNLDSILGLPEKIEIADNSPNQEAEYLKILDFIKNDIKDVALEYSFILFASNRGVFKHNLVEELKNDLKRRGVDLQTLESRFIQKPRLV